MDKKINILFFGDLVGRPGRRVVENYIKSLSESDKPDFIIANVENASHGFGLTQKNHDELASYGIDCFTSGNHIWDKKDIFNYIETSDRLIRPINYPKTVEGVGYRIFETRKGKIAVINVLGRTFMNMIDSPWEIVEDTIQKIKDEVKVIFIDIHAEASAEKLCFAKYFANLNVSAIVGTHTHIQTADERILNDCCVYITDVGFCGDNSGVIGMNYDQSLKRMMTDIPERLDVSESDDLQVNAVLITVNALTGHAETIKRINQYYEIIEGNIIMKG